MSDLDVTLLKSIYNKGYKACVRGEPKAAPYGKQTEKAVEWRRGYDAARKKRVKAVDDGKFDMGKVVESTKPRPSKTVSSKGWSKAEEVSRKGESPACVVTSDVDVWEKGEVDGADRRSRAL